MVVMKQGQENGKVEAFSHKVEINNGLEETVGSQAEHGVEQKGLFPLEVALGRRQDFVFCEELVVELGGYTKIHFQRAKGKEFRGKETEIKNQAGGRKEYSGQRWWYRRTEGTREEWGSH